MAKKFDFNSFLKKIGKTGSKFSEETGFGINTPYQWKKYTTDANIPIWMFHKLVETYPDNLKEIKAHFHTLRNLLKEVDGID